MTAEEYLKKHRIYDDETIYNSVDEMTGTLTQLMESYHIEASKELVEALENFIKAVKNEDIIIQDNVDLDGFGSTGSYLYRMAEKALENHLK